MTIICLVFFFSINSEQIFLIINQFNANYFSKMLRKYYVSFAAPNTYYTIAVQPNYQNFVKEFNRKWHISTTPHKTKNNRTLFKLIQQFIWSPSVAL